MMAGSAGLRDRPVRVAGQPLALLLGIIVVWIWLRVAWLSADDPAFADQIADYARPLAESASAIASPVAAAGRQHEPGLSLIPINVRTKMSTPYSPIEGPRLGGGAVNREQMIRRLQLASLGGRWSWGAVAKRDNAQAPAVRDRWPLVTAELGQEFATSKPGDRWSAAAWLLFRPGQDGQRGALIPRYGASQAGLELGYRLAGATGPQAYIRATSPLEYRDQAELAVGVRMTLPASPLSLHVERRIALGDNGRNAMAAYATGGFSSGSEDGVRIEAYGQAGIVGMASRIPFAEGQLVMRHRLYRDDAVAIAAGAGGWAAAQTGAARVDIGPRIEAKLAAGDGTLGIALEWRQRIAGGAAPSSGPALTLSAAF